MGFWRVYKAGIGLLAARTSALTKKVAKTMGFTTFAKTNHLWLQREARPTNAAAATDYFFRQSCKTNCFSNILLVEITFSL